MTWTQFSIFFSKYLTFNSWCHPPLISDRFPSSHVLMDSVWVQWKVDRACFQKPASHCCLCRRKTVGRMRSTSVHAPSTKNSAVTSLLSSALNFKLLRLYVPNFPSTAKSRFSRSFEKFGVQTFPWNLPNTLSTVITHLFYYPGSNIYYCGICDNG